MPRIFRRLSVLLVCLYLGSGPAVLQVVAWAKMLVDYSSTAGLVEGAKMTFDGEHPCEMCKAIAESRKKDDDSGEDRSRLLSQRLVVRDLVPLVVADAPLPKAIDLLPLKVAAWPGWISRGGEKPPLQPPRDLAQV